MPLFGHLVSLRVGSHHEGLPMVNVKNGNHKNKPKKEIGEFLTLKAIYLVKAK